MVAITSGAYIRDDKAVTYHKICLITNDELAIIYAALGAQYDALQHVTSPDSDVAIRDKVREMVDRLETHMKRAGVMLESTTGGN